MTTNLADIEARAGQQRARPTNNRDTILPRARDTELPSLKVAADPRSARTGTGQADAILEALGMVQNIGQQVAQTYTKAEEDFREAEARSKGIAAYSAADADVRAALDALVNGEQDSNGDGTFDLLDVDIAIDRGFAKHLLDGDGKPVDFGSPEVSMGVAEKLSKLREEMREQYRGVVQERLNDRVIAQSATIFETVQRGREFPLEAFIDSLPASADRGKALKAGLGIIKAQAEATENIEGLDALLAAKRKDGKTPLLGAEVRAEILSKRDQVAGQREARVLKEETAKRKAREAQLFGAMVQDQLPSKGEIVRMVNSNEIGRDFGGTLINAHEERERDARAEIDRAERKAMEAHNRGVEATIGDTRLQWRMGGGPTTQAEFMEEVTRLRRTGGLGSGSAYGSNLGELYSAYQEGRKAITKDPTVRRLGTKLAAEFPKKPPRSSGASAILGGSSGGPDAADTHLMVQNAYYQAIFEKKSPSDAYNAAQAYGLRYQALKAKQAEATPR